MLYIGKSHEEVNKVQWKHAFPRRQMKDQCNLAMHAEKHTQYSEKEHIFFSELACAHEAH